MNFTKIASVFVLTSLSLLAFGQPQDITDMQFDCAQAQELSEDILSSQTLVAGCYRVTSAIEIDEGALLSIEAGSMLQFEEDAGLRIQDGALSAIGDAENPIVFTSAANNPQAADWAGIHFTSNYPENILEHTIVAYAGDRRDAVMGTRTYAAVRVGGRAQVSLRNSSFQHNDVRALLFDDGAQINDFSNNSFSANLGYPVQLESNQLGSLDTESDYAGEDLAENDHNRIDVRGGEVHDTQTWLALNVPYEFNDRTFIVGSAEVTIDPGVRLYFGESNGIRVSDDASLSAVGTEDAPILFTGSSSFPNPGDWAGLHFSSNNPANTLEHSHVEYAGGRADNLMGTRTNAAVRVSNGGYLNLRNSRIAFSSEAGLKLDDDFTTLEPSDPSLDNSIVDNDVNIVDNR